MIIIVTIEDDLHALAIQASLRRREIECHIVETDILSAAGAIQYSIGPSRPIATARTSERVVQNVSDATVIWWRRPKALQRVDALHLHSSHQNLINNDCHGLLTGCMQSVFSGKWISDPKATEIASNKLLQLAVAQRCGFRIPATLVTQCPSALRGFYETHEGKIILKPVVGTPGPLLFTQLVESEHLSATDSIRACPTIYQEYIPGTRHIRFNCFGSRSYAASIDTTDVDWRPNLKVPINRWPVPPELHWRVRSALDALGLEMGVLDFKEMPTGELVWLEVNPQGQFLFLEGLTGEPLTEHFADYLEDELIRAPSHSLIANA